MSQWAIADYRCAACGDFEALVLRPVPDQHECPDCADPADWIISAPKTKVLSVPCSAVVQGGDMKDRPPGMLDTRPLAEGATMSEWKKIQDGHREERRHHELVAKGLKTKRVQVG